MIMSWLKLKLKLRLLCFCRGKLTCNVIKMKRDDHGFITIY